MCIKEYYELECVYDCVCVCVCVCVRALTRSVSLKTYPFPVSSRVFDPVICCALVGACPGNAIRPLACSQVPQCQAATAADSPSEGWEKRHSDLGPMSHTTGH